MAQKKKLLARGEQEPLTLATLPLRDVVVYPGMVTPLFVGREKSIAALEKAMKDDEWVFLPTQMDAQLEDPKKEELYQIGTVANVLQVLRLPDGSVKALVEGIARAKMEALEVSAFAGDDAFLLAQVRLLPVPHIEEDLAEALRRSLLHEFDRLVKISKKIPSEVVSSIFEIEDLSMLLDTVAAQLQLKISDRQAVLERVYLAARATLILDYMESEIEIVQVEKRIRGQVKRQMDKSQREYYLNEQIKAIHKELGEEDERAEMDLLEEKIKSVGMSAEAEEKALSELKKLKMMPAMSAESTVVRNYIDMLCDLPWQEKSEINQDIAHAEKVLDNDHYGLEKVKERILEYLAVQKRAGKLKGPILCLVGPPGVGKTSLGQSIAKATGRKYVRMALGGVHDESEIRGHRRTYIGSMPGKVLQNLSKVGVNNPLFLLDEIDKIGQDFRGDPASALLEVLDPEQNHTFVDHYAEVEYDLSDVMFIATSNTLNIPPALLDRMEIIRLSGYTEEEKSRIAKDYLLPKQIKANGLKKQEIRVNPSAIQGIIRYYTREAGVRALDREIAKICRKVVIRHELASKDDSPLPAISISQKNLHEYLGVRRYDFGKAEEENRVGQVTGLAWTEVGGELLTIEAVALAGKGNIVRTGQLGDVMQESISAALSVVRSRAQSLGIAADFYQKNDIHVHVPEGATPKDGPSAGIAMTLAVASALSGIAVRSDVAMTGEITLRGEVLPIGGLKEKLLAALRGGIKHVLIPKDNVKDLSEIPAIVTEGLSIHSVRWIDEVLDFALERKPMPYRAEENNVVSAMDNPANVAGQISQTH